MSDIERIIAARPDGAPDKRLDPHGAIVIALVSLIGLALVLILTALDVLKAPVTLPDTAPRWMAPFFSMSLLLVLVISISGCLLQLVNGYRQRRVIKAVIVEVEEQAYDRAMRDPLTGLHNRSGFKRCLDQVSDMLSNNQVLGILYVDLDRFKEVNDNHGHETGDNLLIAVTARLEALTRNKVIVARLGGDEFAMIVHGLDTAAEIEELGGAISVEIGKPFLIGSTELAIGASVGVAVGPEDGVLVSELVRRADISMYQSKAAGRGQSHRFHPTMEDELRRRRFLEDELRHAIERNELSVFYQPYFRSDGESIVGVEALLRWTHHRDGPVSPGVFIPISEQCGLINPISDWMMKQALVDIKRWPGLTLSMNLSPVQFRQPDLVASVKGLVDAAGVDVAIIELEVTEGVLVEDAETAITIFNAFRAEGFRLALDDFGTGYSSLSYLRKFQFDKLKVDQVFVRDLTIGSGARAIIHSVVALGRSLGLSVQAEGIEGLEHHIFLRAAGCHYLQGFYFAKPMSADNLDKFIQAKSSRPDLYSLRA